MPGPGAVTMAFATMAKLTTEKIAGAPGISPRSEGAGFSCAALKDEQRQDGQTGEQNRVHGGRTGRAVEGHDRSVAGRQNTATVGQLALRARVTKIFTRRPLRW